jgi:hypothetical protein
MAKPRRTLLQTHLLVNRENRSMSDDKIKVDRRLTAESPTVERRTVPRHSCMLHITCHQIDGPLLEPWTASVRDISEVGISFVHPRPIEQGAFLVVEVPFPNENHPRSLGASVIHSTPREEGGYAVGCAFDQRLAPIDLMALLDTNLLEL